MHISSRQGLKVSNAAVRDSKVCLGVADPLRVASLGFHWDSADTSSRFLQEREVRGGGKGRGKERHEYEYSSREMDVFALNFHLGGMGLKS